MNEIVQTQYAIEPTIEIRLDENPAAVFLAGLGTQNSRDGTRWCLNIAASILSNGEFDCLELRDDPNLKLIMLVQIILVSPVGDTPSSWVKSLVFLL